MAVGLVERLRMATKPPTGVRWRRRGPLAYLCAGYLDTVRPYDDERRRHWAPDPKTWLWAPVLGAGVAVFYGIFGVPERTEPGQVAEG